MDQLAKLQYLSLVSKVTTGDNGNGRALQQSRGGPQGPAQGGRWRPPSAAGPARTHHSSA